MAMHASASARIPAPPGVIFDLITDPWRLPSWNRAITEVVEGPEQLEDGSVWKIRLHALAQTWVSKSQVSAIDPVSRTFAYRSQTDDGNSSYADWEWHVESDPEGSRVTVKVELHPTTFWRKHLLVKVRRPALTKEMQDSLNALSRAACS
jgi:hypothetical protein